MSDVSTPQPEAAEKPAAPEAPVEAPFNVDDLLSCTSRFTHKAWHLFYTHRKDLDFIRQVPVRATLEAASTNGAEELHKILVEAGVQEISRRDRTLHFTATFEDIQKVIRNKETATLDVVKI